MKAQELFSYLDEYLQIKAIADYGPQGLQVEAQNDRVERIALAVDTAPDVINAAAAWGADLLLVHHGLLWRTVERIAGPLGRRVRLLLENHIHLYAAHLALDAHPMVGNNAVLARMLELQNIEWWCDVMSTRIGIIGESNRSLQNITTLLDNELQTTCRVLNHGPNLVRKLAVVSGFGADRAAEAKQLGADTFLTGETSHANYYAASDYDLNVIFAGHYATETVGVKALGEHLANRFDLTTHFFDFPTAM
jgi:dinuclear metal center YbgI/SA1388 family protein